MLLEGGCVNLPVLVCEERTMTMQQGKEKKGK